MNLINSKNSYMNTVFTNSIKNNLSYQKNLPFLFLAFWWCILSSMEALWSLEDKWKLTTQKAVALLGCTCFLVTLGLCAGAVLKRRWRFKRKVIVYQERYSDESDGDTRWPIETRRGWGTVKKALMSSVRWSGACKWPEERLSGRERDRALLVKGGGGEVGWESHNSTSPVWQRPILRGEKCELPRFSGLILYDERGRPLLHHHYDQNEGIIHDFQDDKIVAAGGTTLSEMLWLPTSSEI